MTRVLITALAFLLIFSAPASAEPISAIIATIGTAFTKAAITKTLLKFALQTGLSLLMQKLKGKPKEAGLQNQFKGQGGSAPETTVLGRAAIVGHQTYHNSSGGNNLRYHEIIELGGLPGATVERLIIDGEYTELGALNADWGHVVSIKDKEEGAQPHRAWIKTYDGTQTAADPKMVELYGTDPDRPWTADHKLTGIPYALPTYNYDRKTFQRGVPAWRFEMLGPPMYDPRLDSSVGGTGPQRWDTPSTWAQTENLVVLIYNVMRGITLPGGAIWGGGCEAEDLPIANWAAGMNACDADLDGRPKYRGGIEVKFTEPPKDYVAELLAGCAGQMVELGGVWRIQVDAPATAVISVTDEDMSVSHSAQKDPFPGLESTFNAITVVHPDPDNLWNAKPAETFLFPEWEAEDGTRRVFDLRLPAVPYTPQGKQIANMMAKDNRRFRRHKRVLPPDCFFIEPLQTLSWTSAEHSYAGKLFEIAEAAYDPFTFNVHISMRERDPADFDPDLSLEVGSPIPPTAPIPRVDLGVPGFAFAGVIIDDANGPRRPGFELTWTADDIADTTSGIAYQIRVASTETVVASGTTSDVAEELLRLSGDFLPGETYEARVKPLSLVRDTVWGDWVSAAAPAVSDQVRVVQITAAAQAFEYDASGQNPAPVDGLITATPRNTVGTPWYEFLVAGVSKQNSIDPTYTYVPPASIVDMPELLTVRLREDDAANPVLAEDFITTFGLRSGGTSLQGHLSNEDHNVTADPNGSNPVLTGSGTVIEIFYGATRLTYDGTGTSPGTYAVTPTVHAGTATIGTITQDGVNASAADLTAMTTDVVVIRFAISGQDSSGNAFGMTLDQSLSKLKAGSEGPAGAAALSTRLEPPAVNVTANTAGVVQSYIGSGCTIEVFEGSTALQFTTSASLSPGQWRIYDTDVTPAANDITVGNIIDSGHEATVAAHSNMDNGEDSVTIGYDVQARNLNGSLVYLTAKQSVTKSIAGLGISDINKSGETVTVTYDDGSSTQYTTPDGAPGFSPVVGRIEFVGVSTIIKSADGTYSASYLVFDAVFEQGGVVVGRDRYRVNRTGDTWWTLFDIAGGTQINTSRMTEAGGLQISGNTANCVITYSHGGITSTVSAPVAILQDGMGVKSMVKSGGTLTVTYDDDSTDAFTLNGVASAVKANGVVTITYDDGSTQDLVDGDDGVGISNVTRSGDTVTVTYDDGGTSTFTVQDGVDATYGDADPVTTFTITKDKNGQYSAAYLVVDFEFRKNGSIVAADRFRVNRSGDSWVASSTKPAGGPSTNPTHLVGAVSVSGKSAVLTVTHTPSNARASAPLNIIIDGADGGEGDEGAPGDTGDTIANGVVYYQTLQPVKPNTPAGSNFNLNSGTFGGLASGWDYTAPDVAATDTSLKLWVSRYTVLIDGETGNQQIYFTVPTGAIVFANDIQSDNYVPGVSGWRINRLTGAAEFGSATIRGLLAVGQIKIDSIVLDDDGNGGLTIKVGGVATDLIAPDAASMPMARATGAVLTGSTGGGGYQTAAQITRDVTDVQQVKIDWNFEQAYASGDSPNWGFRIRRGGTTLKSRTNMFFGVDYPGGTFVDTAPGTGNQTYYLDWWSTNDASLTAQGTIEVGGRKV
jgi:hypothetical protein